MSFSSPPPPPPPPGPPPPPSGGYGASGPGSGERWSPAEPKPPNYLVWAILSTLFCCLPFGIVSIVFAAQVDSRYNGGDLVGCKRASEKAKAWAIAATLGGIVVIGLGVVAVGAGSESR